MYIHVHARCMLTLKLMYMYLCHDGWSCLHVISVRVPCTVYLIVWLYLLCRCLCEQFQADLTREDLQGSTVLHYGCASDSAELLLWLLSLPEAKALMDKPNKVAIVVTIILYPTTPLYTLYMYMHGLHVTSV